MLLGSQLKSMMNGGGGSTVSELGALAGCTYVYIVHILYVRSLCLLSVRPSVLPLVSACESD
jgi:hypothetical protein